MTKRILPVVFISLFTAAIALSACSKEPNTLNAIEVAAEQLAQCDKSCRVDTECTIVEYNCFGNMAANSNDLQCFSDAFREFGRSDIGSTIKCKPSPPIDNKHAVCRNAVCVIEDK